MPDPRFVIDREREERRERVRSLRARIAEMDLADARDRGEERLLPERDPNDPTIPPPEYPTAPAQGVLIPNAGGCYSHGRRILPATGAE